MARERNTGAVAAPYIRVRRSSAFWQSTINFARRKPLGAIGGVIILALVLVAIIAPVIAPFDPYEPHVKYKYTAPGVKLDSGERLLFGGDQLGRDVFSRILYGARISLYVGLLSVGIGVTAGALLGIISAYFGGMVDLMVQRIIDALMAFPALILALAVMAVLGSSVNNVIFALVILLVPGACRVVRSQALSVKERVYIDAAKAIGCGHWRIIFRHMLPNCAAPYIVFATANLGYAIVVEASLSFLGLGTPPDVSSWGGMLSVAGQKYVEVSPWLAFFPGLSICVVVFGFNLLGDALRDLLDPRLRSR